MRDYNDETAFLVRMLSYDESHKSRAVQERIVRAQREQACVFKATCTVGLLALLTCFLSQVNFFQSGPEIRLRIVCVLAIADLICMVTFAGVFLIYRLKLRRLRDQCRRIIGDVATRRLVGSPDPLGLPATTVDPAQLSLHF
jgi:hypothetical protein